MIITKETKTLYNFLNKVFTYINNDSKESIVYVDESRRICYLTSTVAGSAIFTKQGEEQMEELSKDMFYEIAKMPRNRIKLKEISAQDISEDMSKSLPQLKHIIDSKKSLACELDSYEYRIASKITRLAKRYISDSYVSIISKHLPCEVYVGGMYMSIERCEYDKDTNIQLDEQVCFLCEDFKTVDENVQGKLQFDFEEEMAGGYQS